MSSAGKRLLSALVAGQDVEVLIGLGLRKELFNEIELPLYSMVMSHLSNFGALPHQDTIIEKLGDTLVDAPEPPAYYMAELEKRHIHTRLKKMINESTEHLKDQDPMKAFELMANEISDIGLFQKRNCLIDFRDIAANIYTDYLAQKKDDDQKPGLFFGWETMDSTTGGLMPGDFCSIVGRPASGKAQPLTSKVLLKSGWTTMGSVKVGDELASIDGKRSFVTGVFPQGVKPLVAINFKDGRRVECCTEHLWEVYSRHWPEKYRVMQAWELRDLLKSKRHQGRLAVRLFSGEFGEDKDLTLPPYLLGALIGDGCFRGGVPMFCTSDPEMEDRISGMLCNGYYLAHRKGYDFAIVDSTPQDEGQRRRPNHYVKLLTDLGLWGHKSQHKFIPAQYMQASYESRLALLQGLMDTDGTASKLGGVSFSTSSRVLADQVVQLVWSLGGGCSGVHVKKTTHLDNYILHIRFDNPQQSFQLKRKKERLPTANQFTGSIRAVIDSVEPIEAAECQCIMVSHPSHLYVTDDYVTTHNTFMELYIANNDWEKGGVPLFLSMEMMLSILGKRLAAMSSHKPLTHLLKGMLTTKAFNHLVKTLELNKEKKHPFWLCDGNMASTVDDVIMLCRQLKPTSCFIDGAYLLRHSNPRISRFDRITENAEMIKQRIATDLGIPCVCSYQFSREVAKKAKNKKTQEKAGLEDIYGSDAIGQLSTISLGLFEDETVETQVRRKVDIMKGRNGETGDFLIHWDFLGMNFSEVKKDTSELQFTG